MCLKKLLILLIFYAAGVYNASAQINSNLTGRWKFIKVALPDSTFFNLHNLTASYKQFFDRQKRVVFHGTITENDSLHINYLFEKAVNDINLMFIEFRANNTYTSNSFNRQGDVSEKTETGTYTFNQATREIKTRLDGKKNRSSTFKVISLDGKKLVIRYANASDGAILTCFKVEK